MTMDLLQPNYAWRNRYLLMRHGHSQANAQGKIISSPERGLTNYGLSEQGEQQLVELLAQWRWPEPTRVVHSDFLRTTQTAARVAAAFARDMQKEERVRERHFGELDGQADSHYPQVWAFDAKSAEHTQWQVEPVSRVATRMCAALEALEQRFEGETVLVVSHGDPLQILLTALASKPLTQHREQPALLPASITLVGG
ncbi:histidine phosphatase family protein [Vreelandella aquamarina]